MDEKILIALIGLAGVFTGAAIQIIGKVIEHCLQQRAKEKTDEKRKKLLTTMLEDQGHSWRRLETLTNVIGADEDTTKRLLLEIDARGSEDGQALWGLVRRNPFKEIL